LATDILESSFLLIVNKHFVIVLFFYFTQISLADRVLCVRPTTHVFVLCRMFPSFLLFHMFFYTLYLHIYLNANIGSLWESDDPIRFLSICISLCWQDFVEVEGCKKWFTDIRRLRKKYAIYVCFFYF